MINAQYFYQLESSHNYAEILISLGHSFEPIDREVIIFAISAIFLVDME
jgi:hypothetical protein